MRAPERIIGVEYTGNPVNAEPYWNYMWSVEGTKPELPVVGFGALISIAIIAFISYLASKIEVAVFAFGSLSLLWFMGLWPMTVQTLALALVAVVGALLVAFPVGILASLSDTFYTSVRPIVDMMQTMPAYVYFVPAVALFGFGKGAGVVATTIFAIPPALRMTNTGLRNVPEIYDEVGDSFGANTFQRLKKIHIPSALPDIMQGVNQCIMYALAMAVIAGWLGAPGLGKLVKDAIWWTSLGPGIEGGIGIVFLAVILDRSSQGLITKAAREYGTEVEEASAAAGF
ncbi:hypothetical protein AKJ52_00810 [candidate division MSBL1 archaeon SCGC-AAA382C18]|uniref:ABC transmembrane type-1 domain-containing protein n=1 Tax=candidate division MSBL1 archaeon SCGC-AAA382C18 TaxID=1698281 RepID=A0A133VL58_9EURY|nr:hypothetical protein AKJ52_00810 [candidate division MSBL1 archaeon SCGC-AAA382C18]